MEFGFEWDAAKAARNRRKHGVGFDDAATVFGDPLARRLDDPDHSVGEPRYLLLGISHRRRALLIVFTERQERIRIISARRSTASERRYYEEISR